MYDDCRAEWVETASDTPDERRDGLEHDDDDGDGDGDGRRATKSGACWAGTAS
jgi:hypothetical protein